MDYGKPLLVLTIGLPGCGKSFYATAAVERWLAGEGEYASWPGLWVVERDVLREALTGSRRDHTQEAAVTRIAHARVREALAHGYVVIVSDTNLKPRYRKELTDIAAERGADVRIVSFLDVPIDTCIARDAERADPVGADVIRRMHKYLLDSGQVID